MTVTLTPAEHAEVLRQIALWPVCPVCDGKGVIVIPASEHGGSSPMINECHECDGDKRIPGPIYLTVEGDPGCIGCFDRWTHAKIHGNDKWLPPSRFVEATGPCETCNGTGREYRYEHIDPVTADLHWQERRCPSCEGTGRKRVELRLTGQSGYGWDKRDGSILFAHATVEVLPVVDHHTSPDLCPRANYIEVAAGISQMIGTAHYVEFVPPGTWNWLTTLTLDPLPVPGRHWIVVLDNVEVDP